MTRLTQTYEPWLRAACMAVAVTAACSKPSPSGPAVAAPAVHQAGDSQAPTATPSSDAEFEIIWNRAAPTRGDMAHVPSEDLYLTRVGLNASTVAFDLKSEGHDSDSPHRGREQPPVVDLYVDGCPVAPPPLPGVPVRFNGPEIRLTIARSALPRGELTFVFKAFTSEFTMYFANDERGFRSITMAEMKGYHVRPGQNGEPDTVSIPNVDCE